MKPFALAILCICTVSLGIGLILLAMFLLKIVPQGLVVLFFAILGLAIIKVLIGILSRDMAVRPVPVRA